MEKLFIFTINLLAKFKITRGLIFRGKRHARPMGAYFKGGLLFRVYRVYFLRNFLSFTALKM